MFLNSSPRLVRAPGIFALPAIVIALAFTTQAHAQAGPTLISVVPADGASGVSPSAPIVFTFSAAMDTTATSAAFFDTSNSTLTTIVSWSADAKTLTYTPSPAFPTPDEIIWTLSGQDTSGNPLQGTSYGTYSIGSGGGGGGSTPCTTTTNTNTTFTINESWLFDQTSASPPVPDTNTPYSVLAEVLLVSNITATAASLTLPDNTTMNMENLGIGQTFLLTDYPTTSNALTSVWQNGNYTFNLTGSSISAVTVAWSIAQPNTPQVENYAAAQAVDSAKAFTLTWNAFTSRVATNEIFVNIGYDPCAGTGFYTNLAGTATSVTIPAGALQPGSNYVNSTLGFLNADGKVNASPKYSTGGSHGSVTSFTLTTIGGSALGSLTFSNPLWSGSKLSFDITASPDTSITVETSATLQAGSWTTLVTTNSGSGTVTITDTPSKTIPHLFYRAHQ